MSDIRTIVASALCDAMNGAGAWECLPKASGGQVGWLHRADKVIHELAEREHRFVSMDEIERLEQLCQP